MINSVKFFWRIVLLLLTLLVVYLFIRIYPSYLWFVDVGFKNVFLISTLAKIGLFAVFFLGTFLFFAANLFIAQRIIRDVENKSEIVDSLLDRLFKQDKFTYNPVMDLLKGAIRRYTLIVLLVVIALVSFVVGGVQGYVQWDKVLRFIYQAPSTVIDPLFGKSISFYFFSLPFYNFIVAFLMLIIVIALIILFAVYLQFGLLRISLSIFRDKKIKAHLLTLGALFFVLLAIKFWLSRYGLLLTTGGKLFHGPGYTDIHAGFLNYAVLAGLSLLTGAILFLDIYIPTFKPVIMVLFVLLVSGVFFGGIYPGLIQNFVVNPNEYEKEKPYLEHNINYTRKAFNLENVSESFFPALEELNMNEIRNNKEIIDNIRVWDETPILKTFSQLQEIRLYYEFANVDVDRYDLGGKSQQVMISARELIGSQLSDKAQSWVNRKLQYTHGYGVVMSPVNQFTSDGMPEFYIKNIPPVSTVPYKINRPEIYFGERANEYVIVNTDIKEFDYPKGDDNVYTQYAGGRGIAIDSWLNRLLYSVQFGDKNIFFTSYIKKGSKILYNRNIMDRVKTIVPFITYDRDPYVVVADGRIYWMMDGYTLSNQYPYSQPFNNSINYIRNSVKITVDAYDGTVAFYLMDEKDPIIKTYQSIFKGVFKPFSQMPDSLKSHVRVPNDYFAIQAHMYRNYHMTNPQVFYNQEDVWEIPKQKNDESEAVMEPYYITMKLPDENNFDFLQLIPYTPSNKNNLISWLVSKNNPDEYGKLSVYKLSKERQIFGPTQIESRIDQDTYISQQLTLWGQKGSTIIRGNILIIPIENSLVYVEPLYLQATASNLPQLKRVIVAYGDNVVMETDLEKAIAKVFGNIPITENVAVQTTGNVVTASPEYERLAKQALDNYNEALEKQKSGDWAGYGESLRKLRNVLEQLAKFRK
ncbi:MAG: UPF0182 family protein [Candidatus Margulisiibacteriota bacterium]|nr:MAG: hypothetical protein A2X43_06655 [Candidatus Margulisbacteria bacterium GWD2_39_127]OGI05300.1 MAG: hypothetical protein A2X42_03830 [Candidatus Margulisbacteria bacterium GWF2_38_17]OGI10841.1 MAG: hypothetical protein A2X41_05645 [Candidatus Margulisbacteria bacterium GWE2_39_32]PZM83527.1 MAG: UPF0182 family protein [Candidatus Margulisiibacteriota bacterium]HAR64295.1 UPF0182 family protein [Candidatus Margulisiibacteriota bacterium]